MEITRRSIVRRSILREYCTCSNALVISVNDIPWMVSGDNMGVDEFDEFLLGLSICPTIYFSEPISKCHAKMRHAIERGISVTLSTYHIPNGEIVKLLSGNPWNSIWIHIDPVGKFLETLYGTGARRGETLLKMFHKAKKYGISLSLEIDVPTRIGKFLDTLEIIEISKNFITDMYVWELPMTGDPTSYDPSLMTSGDFISRMSSFVKHKRVTVESMGVKWGNTTRIRHFTKNKSFGYSFMHRKIDFGKFEHGMDVEEPCPICGMTKFT